MEENLKMHEATLNQALGALNATRYLRIILTTIESVCDGKYTKKPSSTKVSLKQDEFRKKHVRHPDIPQLVRRQLEDFPAVSKETTGRLT